MRGSAEPGRDTGRRMSSQVNWLVLGLVIERPSYGHELFSRYERRYSGTAPVSGSSHVYTALNALEARGLIERFSVDQSGRQPRAYHRATPEGVRGYQEWLVDLIDMEQRGCELLAQQLGMLARAPAVGLRILERLEQRCLEASGQVGAPSARSMGVRDELVDDLVNERLRIAVGGTLSWLRHAIERFEALVSNGSA